MGPYGRVVVPWLIDLAMASPIVERDRAALVPRAAGRVLEVGIGSARNAPFYTRAVAALVGVDPSPGLLARAGARAARAPVAVRLVAGAAERLPARAAAFDTVVMTWTLCSVADPEAALAEIRRVLVPGGRLVFVEHGLSPDARIAAWQRRLTPLWRRLAGGCHLDRRPAELIAAAGFGVERVEAGYLPGPRLFTYRVTGVATDLA